MIKINKKAFIAIVLSFLGGASIDAVCGMESNKSVESTNGVDKNTAWHEKNLAGIKHADTLGVLGLDNPTEKKNMISDLIKDNFGEVQGNMEATCNVYRKYYYNSEYLENSSFYRSEFCVDDTVFRVPEKHTCKFLLLAEVFHRNEARLVSKELEWSIFRCNEKMISSVLKTLINSEVNNFGGRCWWLEICEENKEQKKQKKEWIYGEGEKFFNKRFKQIKLSELAEYGQISLSDEALKCVNVDANGCKYDDDKAWMKEISHGCLRGILHICANSFNYEDNEKNMVFIRNRVFNAYIKNDVHIDKGESNEIRFGRFLKKALYEGGFLRLDSCILSGFTHGRSTLNCFDSYVLPVIGCCFALDDICFKGYIFRPCRGHSGKIAGGGKLKNVEPELYAAIDKIKNKLAEEFMGYINIYNIQDELGTYWQVRPDVLIGEYYTLMSFLDHVCSGDNYQYNEKVVNFVLERLDGIGNMGTEVRFKMWPIAKEYYAEYKNKIKLVFARLNGRDIKYNTETIEKEIQEQTFPDLFRMKYCLINMDFPLMRLAYLSVVLLENIGAVNEIDKFYYDKYKVSFKSFSEQVNGLSDEAILNKLYERGYLIKNTETNSENK